MLFSATAMEFQTPFQIIRWFDLPWYFDPPYHGILTPPYNLQILDTVYSYVNFQIILNPLPWNFKPSFKKLDGLICHGILTPYHGILTPPLQFTSH